MLTGTLKWFNTEKGYGFITPDNGSADIFIHKSALEDSGLRSVQDGKKYEYEIKQDKKTGKDKVSFLRAI